MLMYTIAHGSCLRGHRKKVCTESWLWETKSLGESNLHASGVCLDACRSDARRSTDHAVLPRPSLVPTEKTLRKIQTHKRFKRALFTRTELSFVLINSVFFGLFCCFCKTLRVFGFKKKNVWLLYFFRTLVVIFVCDKKRKAFWP